MAVYKNSFFFTLTNDGSFVFETKCEVILNDSKIVLSYFDEGEPVTYLGVNHHNDHFTIECKANGGYGSLHRFPNDKIFVGDWVEEGYEGLWKLTISE